ncbi:MAG: nucleotidyltransferase family protein [Oscillospiraceae bacterium]|nr:nucleotidyltransferase family protein [Oscillospiraceae bacterium]
MLQTSSDFTKAERTVAVVSEYNPFHNGHLRQIEKIKEMFPGATIISIMSGALVQRGETAIFSKYDRAEIAVLNGVDAVFELPSAYSCAPANIFAFNAVWIMQKLSGVDCMCFGSECGDLELLEFAAEKIAGEEFNSKLSETIKTDKNKSYQNRVYSLFRAMYGERKASALLGSNDILAIEYLKALKKSESQIAPFAIKREGEPFNSEKPGETISSASYIRKSIKSITEKIEVQNFSPLEKLEKFMPGPAYEMASGLIKKGKFADIENLAPAIISHLSRLGACELAKIAEIGGGMEYRIKKSLDGCFEFGSLVERLRSKHNSPSAIRRALMCAFFGITKKMRENPPDFASLLALNQKGARFVGQIRKKAAIRIATKPADMKGDAVFAQNCFIDNVCKLALHDKSSEINEMRQKPRLI